MIPWLFWLRVVSHRNEQMSRGLFVFGRYGVAEARYSGLNTLGSRLAYDDVAVAHIEVFEAFEPALVVLGHTVRPLSDFSRTLGYDLLCIGQDGTLQAQERLDATADSFLAALMRETKRSMDVTTAASEELLAVKERLRAVASRLSVHPPASRPDPLDEQPIQLLKEVDELLESTRSLTRPLADNERAGQWDEVDGIVGRVALRDVARAVAHLRRLVTIIEAEVLRANTQVRPLTEAINDAETKLLEDLLQSAEREARSKGPR